MNSDRLCDVVHCLVLWYEAHCEVRWKHLLAVRQVSKSFFGSKTAKHTGPSPLKSWLAWLSLFVHSLWRRANARNVSFPISVRWSIYIINSVDKPNFRVSLPHRRSTTVSLETNPLFSLFFVWLHCRVNDPENWWTPHLLCLVLSLMPSQMSHFLFPLNVYKYPCVLYLLFWNCVAI